jgi:hypothetical protein
MKESCTREVNLQRTAEKVMKMIALTKVTRCVSFVKPVGLIVMNCSGTYGGIISFAISVMLMENKFTMRAMMMACGNILNMNTICVRKKIV